MIVAKTAIATTPIPTYWSVERPLLAPVGIVIGAAVEAVEVVVVAGVTVAVVEVVVVTLSGVAARTPAGRASAANAASSAASARTGFEWACIAPNISGGGP